MKSKIIFAATLPSWIIFIILMIPLLGGLIIPYGLSLLSFVIFAWFLIVGIALQESLPSEIKMSPKWFIFNLFYAFVYVLIKDSFFVKAPLYLAPFHLFAIYSAIYALYFVSKCLVISEEKNLCNLIII